MNREYYEDLKERCKSLSKEEAIKELETILFLIQQDDFMEWDKYYACKQLLEEMKGNK